jgi:hypothetical protein
MLIDKSNQNQESQPYCPLTGVRVLEYGSKQISLSGLLVTWWPCPACNGWHILTTKMNQEEESSKLEPIYQPISL